MKIAVTLWKFLLKCMERVPFPVLVFLILASTYLNFTLTGNEEHYLALSKFFMYPDWIPGASNLSEEPGTRLLYQYISGGLLGIFSFEQTVFIGRLAIILAFSFLLSRFYRRLEFSGIDILLHLPLLFMSQQSFLGNEWVMLDFEPKQLAYIFVFWALICHIEQRYIWTIVLLVIATYFHILVGIWLAIAVVITAFAFTIQSKWHQWVGLFLFVLAVLPMIYLINRSGVLNVSNDTAVNPDWIYTYFRNKHHVAIFTSANYFIGFHLRGVIMVFLAFLLLGYLNNHYKSSPLSSLIPLTNVSLSIMLLGVVISLLDGTGILLKFHLFRLGAVTNFLLFSILILIFKLQFLTKENRLYYRMAVLLLFFFIQYPRVVNNAIQFKTYFAPQALSFEEVTQFISTNTPKESKVLYLDQQLDGHLSFHRLAKRERFVVKKFVPAQRNQLYPWYQKIKAKERLLIEQSYLDSFLENFPHEYILIHKSRKKLDFQLDFQNEDYMLYRVGELGMPGGVNR